MAEWAIRYECYCGWWRSSSMAEMRDGDGEPCPRCGTDDPECPLFSMESVTEAAGEGAET